MKILVNVVLVLFVLASVTINCFAEEGGATAQEAPSSDFPETDIFLFDFDPENKNAVLNNPLNVSNRPGYDNQPYFTKGSNTFLYSRNNGNQTDIYEYLISTGDHKRLTNSKTSEFSPTPSLDNKIVSFVSERNSSIWQAARGDEDNPQWSFEASGLQEPVGYFARNLRSGDILFWSRYGYSVTLTNAAKETYHYVSGNAVPATPHLIPGTDNFSYVHRQANGTVWIKELNPLTKAVRPLTEIVGNNANYAWTPNGAIVQIEGTALYYWMEDSKNGWQLLADLSDHGLKSANRIAVSPDGKKIAVVGLAKDQDS